MSDRRNIVLGHASIRAELQKYPKNHNLTPEQAERLRALPDVEITTAVLAATDAAFWDAYASVHRRAIACLADDRLVCIVHVSNADYDEVVAAAEDEGGAVVDVVAQLARWDYAEENDHAATINGYTRLETLRRQPHAWHEAEVGGLHYWLVIDHGLRFFALYRRPMDVADPVTERKR